MTINSEPCGWRNWPAFTLIETIGVLAVIAILALALTPILIRRMDRIAGEKETAQLKAFAEGFRQTIKKTKSITNETGWAEVIGGEIGLSIDQVRINERRVARVFLIDPAFQIFRQSGSTGPPPYTQDRFGSTNQPINPRLMIISSISRSLPTIPTNSTTAFNNIWDAPEETIPVGWSWNGKPEDLKTQRIHLADLFVPLVLNHEGTLGQGRYSIDGSSVALLPSIPITMYFIDGTLLELYNLTNTTPQYSEILHRAKSFTFADGSWRQGGDFKSKAIDRPKPLDLQLAAEAFLVADLNPWRDVWTTNLVTPQNVYDTMISYMSNYVTWAASGFLPANGQPPAPVSDAQVSVNSSTLKLGDAN